MLLTGAHRDGGDGGSPSAISATSRASFEMGLDLDAGGRGDMVWGQCDFRFDVVR
jgi:hypothetical protein